MTVSAPRQRADIADPLRAARARRGTTDTRTDLFVTSFFGSSIQRFAGPLTATPAAPLPTAGHSGADYATKVARRPWPLTLGRDGNLYTTDLEASPGVARVDGALGGNAGKPAPAPGQSGDTFTPGLASSAIGVGLDGNLYVGAGTVVQRIDAKSGAVLGTFTSGYALGPIQTLALQPRRHALRRHLRQLRRGTDRLHRPEGRSGQVRRPLGGDVVVRYDAAGAFLGTFVTVSGSPRGLGFFSSRD